MAFENFPYTDLHTLNMDWLLKKLVELGNRYAELDHDVKDIKAWTERFAAWVENYFDRLNVSQEVYNRLQQMLDNGDLAALFDFVFYIGRGRAWRVFNAAEMSQQAVQFSWTLGAADATESTTGLWITNRKYRALDMPVEPGAVAIGSCDGYGAWPVNITVGDQLLGFRIQSREDINNETINQSFFIMGQHATPPGTPPYAASSIGANAVAIAKTYYDERVNNTREFAYGSNYTYASSNALNDADGKALMECDTLVLMCMLGIPYANSPWAADTAANATYNFENLQTGSQSWILPWKYDPDYGGRITDIGSQGWYCWHNNLIFDSNALADGDIVFFRSATSKWFDNLIHIGIISMESGEPWVYHVSQWRKPAELTAPIVRHDKLQDLIDSNYYGTGIPYFARPDYTV